MKKKLLTHNRSFFKTIIYWGFVLVFLTMIYFFSSQSGIKSNIVSKHIIKSIAQNFNISHRSIDVLKSSENIDINLIFRKIAHFTEYLILAILLYKALIVCKVKSKRIFIYIWVLCILFALFDEMHQMFVPGRTPKILDIFIDSLGAITGLTIIWFKKANLKYK